jgi:hypothetical protein
MDIAYKAVLGVLEVLEEVVMDEGGVRRVLVAQGTLLIPPHHKVIMVAMGQFQMVGLAVAVVQIIQVVMQPLAQTEMRVMEEMELHHLVKV